MCLNRVYADSDQVLVAFEASSGRRNNRWLAGVLDRWLGSVQSLLRGHGGGTIRCLAAAACTALTVIIGLYSVASRALARPFPARSPHKQMLSNDRAPMGHRRIRGSRNGMSNT
jgi:hypothetical protein